MLEVNNLHHSAFMTAIGKHNATLTNPNDAINPTIVVQGDQTQRFTGMSDLVSTITQIVKALEGNDLAVNREALKRAEDNLRETFVNQICLEEIASGLEAARGRYGTECQRSPPGCLVQTASNFPRNGPPRNSRSAPRFSYLKNNKDEQFNLFASEPMPQEEIHQNRATS